MDPVTAIIGEKLAREAATRKSRMTPAQRKARNALVTSRIAFGVCVAVSLVGNVLAAPRTAIGVGVSLWPPLAFLLTVMLLENVPAKGRVGYVRKAGIAAVAAIAGWASYWHLHAVCVMANMDGVTSYLLPLTVDVVIAFASPGIRRKALPTAPSRRKPQVKPDTGRKLKAV